ncbi:hypothetical protein [Pelobacter seleniigenes]|uniref:hypothetical protein n=1 Tax=Pelobacter seleniigenes TaxID=407188 RepID=UPI0012BA2DB6|nr:hypothetical protein [Pelobacter seleniigenes]
MIMINHQAFGHPATLPPQGLVVFAGVGTAGHSNCGIVQGRTGVSTPALTGTGIVYKR